MPLSHTVPPISPSQPPPPPCIDCIRCVTGGGRVDFNRSREGESVCSKQRPIQHLRERERERERDNCFGGIKWKNVVETPPTVCGDHVVTLPHQRFQFLNDILLTVRLLRTQGKESK